MCARCTLSGCLFPILTSVEVDQSHTLEMFFCSLVQSTGFARTGAFQIRLHAKRTLPGRACSSFPPLRLSHPTVSNSTTRLHTSRAAQHTTPFSPGPPSRLLLHGLYINPQPHKVRPRSPAMSIRSLLIFLSLLSLVLALSPNTNGTMSLPLPPICSPYSSCISLSHTPSSIPVAPTPYPFIPFPTPTRQPVPGVFPATDPSHPPPVYDTKTFSPAQI